MKCEKQLKKGELIREGTSVMSTYIKQVRERRCGKCLRSYPHNSLHAASALAAFHCSLKLVLFYSVFIHLVVRYSHGATEGLLSKCCL